MTPFWKLLSVFTSAKSLTLDTQVPPEHPDNAAFMEKMAASDLRRAEERRMHEMGRNLKALLEPQVKAIKEAQQIRELGFFPDTAIKNEPAKRIEEGFFPTKVIAPETPPKGGRNDSGKNRG